MRKRNHKYIFVIGGVMSGGGKGILSTGTTLAKEVLVLISLLLGDQRFAYCH